MPSGFAGVLTRYLKVTGAWLVQSTRATSTGALLSPALIARC